MSRYYERNRYGPREEDHYEEEEKRHKSASKDKDRETMDDDIPIPTNPMEIEWRDHKDALDNLFFKNNELVHKHTPEHREFWEFFEKYVKFRKSKMAKLANDQLQTDQKPSTNAQDTTETIKLDFPSKYDDRYLISFSLKTVMTVNATFLDKRRQRSTFSEEVLQFFRKGIHLYVNFCQRRDFQKIVKIKEDRTNLPIYKYRDQILEAVHKSSSSAVIVAGDTGCGKSTQVVQYLVESGYDKIACTQPRRIATMALCRRVAYETLNEYGSSIAYQIRFDSTKTQRTRIVFLTEGLLLRQLASDSLLSQYNVIVVDEVHERHIHGDFLLGVLKDLIAKRPELKLILMSATINVNLFSEYFNNAPIIFVPGRMYPIQVEFLPVEDEAKEKEREKFREEEKKKDPKKQRMDPRPYLRILERIDQQFPPTERGDLLVFLCGMEDILTLEEEIKKYARETKSWIVLALHSTLSIEEQDKVFDVAPEGIRKCILSTNIAETSITIDGIRFCIDSGKVKEMAFDSESKMNRLQEYFISKASAEQRKGRAGRTGPGYCFRLYSKEDYLQFADYPVPEIQRIPLHSTVLQIKILGLGNPRTFEFIEKPSLGNIEEAVEKLKQLEALNDDAEESLTPLGTVLAKLPVDVSIGKLLVLGTIFRVLKPLLTLAAALSVQSPFVRRTSEEAAAARNKFISEHGDPFTLLNLFDEWIYLKVNTRDNTRKWCQRHGVEEQRLYEMSKLRKQFEDLLHDCGLMSNQEDDEDGDWSVIQYPGLKERKADYERRMLNRKKRQLQQLQLEREKKRGRRVLRMEEEVVPDGEGEEEEEIDLRDIDFKISHKEKDLIAATGKNLTNKEISLIKLILLSGLYPNIAIGDEHNAAHKELDQMFHTQHKQFISLHPSSIFSGQVALVDQSTNLLGYEKLLETNKAYLTNVFKFPALHGMLLCAQTIDTNRQCSRFVVDNWLELELLQPSMGPQVVHKAVALRVARENLMSKKLGLDKAFPMTQEDGNVTELPPFMNEIRIMSKVTSAQCNEEELADKLMDFLSSIIPFKMRRIRESEIMSKFAQFEEEKKAEEEEMIGPQLDPMAQLEMIQRTQSASFEITKGGIKINKFLRYGSLLDDAEKPITANFSEHMKKHYHCEKCGGDFMFDLNGIKLHVAECHQDIKEEEQQTETRTRFVCEKCNQTLLLTKIEILRHRKSHS